MSVFKELRKGINRILWGIPNRYGHFVREIRRGKCHTILEIGVWNGDRSVRMIKTALENDITPETIRYYGFDLFENADENVVSLEASKFPPSIDMVRNKLKAFSDIGVDIHLYKGPAACHPPPEAPRRIRTRRLARGPLGAYETAKS